MLSPATSTVPLLVSSSSGMRGALPLRHGRFFSVALSASSTHHAQRKIQSTQRWFERIVIGEKMCPFASPLLKQEGLLRIVSSNATDTQQAIQHVQTEVIELVGNDCAAHETTLVVLDKDSFVKDYLDFVRLSWELQDQANMYKDKLQLVLFHPLATHQTYASGQHDSPADYTIRSPYPTVHLLREEDVLKAVTSGYPDLEYLPSRNKAKLTDRGIDHCRRRLQECYADADTNTANQDIR
jgi:uncharacterized protein